MPTGDLADLLDEAAEAGRISDAEREEALHADAVARGVSRASGDTVHLVVEASVTLGKEDVDRAIRRASLIARGFGSQALPVVVSARVPEKIATEGVELVLFGYGRPQGAA